jgi:hypothetical protein
MRYFVALLVVIWLLAPPPTLSDKSYGEDPPKAPTAFFYKPKIVCIPGTSIFRFVVSGELTNDTGAERYSIVLGNLCQLFFLMAEQKNPCLQINKFAFCESCIEHPLEIPYMAKDQVIHFAFWCDVSGSKTSRDILKTIHICQLIANQKLLIRQYVFDPYL